MDGVGEYALVEVIDVQGARRGRIEGKRRGRRCTRRAILVIGIVDTCHIGNRGERHRWGLTIAALE